MTRYKCIDNKDFEKELTIGKFYESIEDYGDAISLSNDLEKHTCYKIERFNYHGN